MTTARHLLLLLLLGLLAVGCPPTGDDDDSASDDDDATGDDDDATGDDDDATGDDDDSAGDDDDSTDPFGGTQGTDEEDQGDREYSTFGCSCDTADRGTSGAWWLVLAGLVGVRRRR